jgi:hypothetical protein
MCDVSKIQKEFFDLLMDKEIEEIIGSDLKCKVINSKKIDYYQFKYDPKDILNKINPIFEDKYQVFDFQKKKNCCYCISISLYFKPQISLVDIYKYLNSIYASIRNAKLFLSNWLVRLYLDSSVHQVLEKTSDPFICKVYNQIFNEENVEIHIYQCQDIPMERIRTFRFLPMIDETVAKCAVREADGYLCKLDCHNIMLFEKMDQIFYFPAIFQGSGASIYDDNTKIGMSIYDIQSKWLYLYKQNDMYFKNHQNIYSLLAGLLTLNLKVQKNKFLSSYLYVLSLIDSMQNENDKKTLQIGFDEVFLLHLFKESLSIETTNSDTFYYKLIVDPEEAKQVSSLVIGYYQYENVNLECYYQIEKCWDELFESDYLTIPLEFYENFKQEIPDPKKDEILEFQRNNLTLLKILDSFVNFDYPKIFNLTLNGIDAIVFPLSKTSKINSISLLSLLNIPYENPDLDQEESEEIIKLGRALRDYEKENDPKFYELLVQKIIQTYQKQIQLLNEYYEK